MEETVVKSKKVEKFDIEALGEYVVVKKAEAESISAGGIVLEGVSQDIHEATVHSVGSEVNLVSVGDVVLLPPMAGRPVDIRGNEVVVLTQKEIMVKILD
tara:strand:+ start:1957 stop:2256 length:300 start_codon:yes stop_codon:yes gene_type:complete